MTRLLLAGLLATLLLDGMVHAQGSRPGAGPRRPASRASARTRPRPQASHEALRLRERLRAQPPTRPSVGRRSGPVLKTPRGAELTRELSQRIRQNQLTVRRARFASEARALQAIDELIVKVNTQKAPPPRFDHQRGLRTFETDVEGPVGRVRTRRGWTNTRRLRVVVDKRGRPIDATPIPNRRQEVLSLTAIQEQGGAHVGLGGTVWDIHVRDAASGHHSVNAKISGGVTRLGTQVVADVSIHLLDAPRGAQLPPQAQKRIVHAIAKFSSTHADWQTTHVLVRQPATNQEWRYPLSAFREPATR